MSNNLLTIEINNKNHASLKLRRSRKVFVGMSGGVDSSVAALLLKNAKDKNGNHIYDVTGVFIKVWTPDFIECTWREDRRDAMRVCSELDIPFITLDLEKEYKEGVIDYMIDEYKKGRTPNPDVFCNKEVKFGAFLDWALKNGGDYVATGHYTRLKTQDSRLKKNTKTDLPPVPSQGRGEMQLKKAKDTSKDQSYFLWTLNKKQLSKIIFPIGDLLKSEIRQIAEKNNLFVAKKKDSQGLCFIGKIDVKDFLKEYIKDKKGKIFDQDLNKNIGEHDGVYFYTIGEKVNGKYVVKKDIKKNILYVVQDARCKTQDTRLDNKIILEQINFTQKLEKNKIYNVQERYHAKETSIKILDIKENKSKKEISIKYELINNNFLYTEGQSLVFYDDQILIGGGIMK